MIAKDLKFGETLIYKSKATKVASTTKVVFVFIAYRCSTVIPDTIFLML